jgi:hypothetical protein
MGFLSQSHNFAARPDPSEIAQRHQQSLFVAKTNHLGHHGFRATEWMDIANASHRKPGSATSNQQPDNLCYGTGNSERSNGLKPIAIRS